MLAQFAERGPLREGIDPAFAGRADLALALHHAAREETVRRLQNAFHADEPIEELVKLAHALLVPAGE